MNNNFEYSIINPDSSLDNFVELFWSLKNLSDEDNEMVVIPDGRIDIIFTRSTAEPYRIGLIGIESLPSQHIMAAGTVMFGVSLKLLSVEYLLEMSISKLINAMLLLPDDFWDVTENDMTNFYEFCQKVSGKIRNLLPQNIDERKVKLFDYLYSSNGSLTVKDISEKVGWSSRQINRYFNQQFGLSLKSFANILRFRASFTHIKQGKLFPEQNFSDQAHFIKEVKKLAGVSPKELFKNQNDRFIQLSTLR